MHQHSQGYQLPSNVDCYYQWNAISREEIFINTCRKQNIHNYTLEENKMLSYSRETALQGALQFSPKAEDWNWETIFYGHYRLIFNHCDIISLKICRIP